MKTIKRSLKIAGWNKMEYDRSLTLKGIEWLRVKGGFGGRGDREDWVAVLPAPSVCVCDYQWRPPYFGFTHYKSREAAMLGELRDAFTSLGEKVKDLDKQRATVVASRERIRKALKL